MKSASAHGIVSRRKVLRTFSLTAGSLAVIPLLQARGGSAAPSPTSAPASSAVTMTTPASATSTAVTPTPVPVAAAATNTPAAQSATAQPTPSGYTSQGSKGQIQLLYSADQNDFFKFYLATGMQTTEDEAVAAGTGLDLPLSLWIGPDLVGSTHLLNPLHPDVRSWMLGYLDALLEQVGDFVDAFVHDEAYYVSYGSLGPSACPGYADRGQIALIQEMAARCHRFRSDLAFLTADNLGVSYLEHRVFPYCLFADGIYQDSWCRPQTWDAVRFPTWRNVAWSCNWAPVTNLAFTRYGVLNHHAPVAISNGCFGDDTGLAEMSPDVLHQIADLWHARTRREWAKSLIVVDTFGRESRDAQRRIIR